MDERVKLFGIEIDRVSLRQAVDRVHQWMEAPFAECHYIVTPNVDHIVMLQENRALGAAYQKAAMVVADGRPVVAASRLFRQSLPECVPGSDLVPSLFASAREIGGLKFFLLGAAPGVAERAQTRIESDWPGAEGVGVYSPPLGFQHDKTENERIVSMINEAEPDLLVIGLGAPKQELWVADHADKLKAKVAVCAGATIDFLAGEKKRAPRWIQRLSLEWLHRMCSEPKRLIPRYSKDAWLFPQILFQQWRIERQR